MEHQSLQDWALDAARLAGIHPMIADSSGEVVILDEDDGSIHTPTLLSEEDSALLERARLAQEIAKDLMEAFSTWQHPEWLGGSVAYVLHAAITGSQFDILPYCEHHEMFFNILQASFRPTAPVWAVINDLRPAPAVVMMSTAEKVWVFMRSSKEYAERIDQTLRDLAAQNARPEDVNQMIDGSIIYDALKEQNLGDETILVLQVKAMLVEFIKAKMP